MGGFLRPGSTTRSAALTGGAVAALLICTQFLFPGTSGAGRGTPIGLLFLGSALGLSTALTAVGIILIYRTSRVINFAQSAMGALGGTFTYMLMIGLDWPFIAALLVGIVVGAGIGMVFELAIVRRFFNAPRLTLTVMTIVAIGVLVQLSFQVIGYGIFGDLRDLSPSALRGEADIVTPFNDWTFQIGDLSLQFGFAELFSIGMAGATFAGVWYFLYRTKAGVAVRAASENTERAELLGIPIKSLSTIVWTMAGGMSAIALINTATMTSFASGGQGAIQSFPRALAAAVIARMRSIPIAITAALGIEVGARAIQWSFPQRVEVVDIALLVIVVGSLFFFREKGRAGEGEATSWEATEEVRPTPRELLAIPSVNYGRWAIGGIIIGFLLLYPWIFSIGATNRAGVVLIQGIVLLSLVVLTGWSGQVSLGQWALVAIAAVIGGAFTFRLGISFWLAVPAVSILTALIAAVIGLPALRIRGLYLAVSTFVLAVAVQTVLFDEDYFSWLLPERVDRPTAFLLDFEDERSMYYLIVIGLVLAVAAVYSLRRTRTGRVLIGMRENEANMESFGINLVRTRLAAFAISGFLAGLAGVLYAHHQRAIDAASYNSQLSLNLFIIALLGGVGSISGAMLGVGWLGITTVLGQISGPAAVFIGVFITGSYGPLIILYISTKGFSGIVFALRDGIYKIVAQRRQLNVPALFEDRDPESLEKQLAPLTAPDGSTGLSRLGTTRYSQESALYKAEEATHRDSRAEEASALSAAAAHVSGEEED